MKQKQILVKKKIGPKIKSQNFLIKFQKFLKINRNDNVVAVAIDILLPTATTDTVTTLSLLLLIQKFIQALNSPTITFS